MSSEQDWSEGLSRERLYRAVVQRDASFEGVFYVGVTTTGVFCRPGCPAKTPRDSNCAFFASASAALQAGFRACRRCRPLGPSAGAPAWAEAIVERMSREPERVLSAADLRAVGADPAAASRYFKSRFGSSVQALSRARRVGVALRWIREGQTVARAMGRAGFASESGFRKAVKDLFGSAPGEAARAGVAPIVACWLTSPLGPMIAGASERGVCLLEFVDRRGLATQLSTLRRRLGRPIVPGRSAHLVQLEQELQAYFRTGAWSFGVALDAPGTEFQSIVWTALRTIPSGTTCSYADLAAKIGRPAAVRAVARANGDNRVAIVIPCHRVIGSDGSMTGYGGGVWRKRRLLALERSRGGERSDGRVLAAAAPSGQGVLV